MADGKQKSGWIRVINAQLLQLRQLLPPDDLLFR